ncbi:four helix bundle protein [Chitinophaga rupis]|uniref:Four helix bundle protein n=1 Tax=Chitinophaga rupis TaxID=573321 RepID=A0A1H7LAS1_9BACT|nr:four helix bundle protein [Chitinophaga rupis]SEK96072.1 four helix bundle protein [Chitinophaga rupis]
MDQQVMLVRTKNFAITVGKLLICLPYSVVNKAYTQQTVRCSSSVGANYRAACRGKSTADFINKLKIVEEELDETLYFLELLQEFNKDFTDTIRECYREGNELLSIIVATINTCKKKQLSQANLKS